MTYHPDNFTIPLMTLIWGLLIIMGTLALDRIRRRYYDVFLYSHHFIYPILYLVGLIRFEPKRGMRISLTSFQFNPSIHPSKYTCTGCPLACHKPLVLPRGWNGFVDHGLGFALCLCSTPCVCDKHQGYE